MSTIRWIGAVGAVAQVNTLTPGSVSIGDTFTITINSKSVTYTSTAGTVLDVIEGLIAAIQDSDYGEFQTLSATANTANTALLLTNTIAGQPFTQTSSSSGGTLVTSTTTANTGPSVLNAAGNWSGGVNPANGDDVYFDNLDIPVLYNLDSLSAVTLASLNIAISYAGMIGLPLENSDGTTPYHEYRPCYLKLPSTIVNVGTGTVGDGQGIRRFKYDASNVATTVNIWFTGGAIDTVPGECMLFIGTHGSNVINNYRGTLACAIYAGELATVSVYRNTFVDNPGSDSHGRFGFGCTLGTIVQNGGDVEINSAVTNYSKEDGILYVYGTGAITTLSDRNGFTKWTSSGTITNLNLGSTVLDSSEGVVHTVTNCTIYRPGWVINDPRGQITFTNPIQLGAGIQLADGVFNMGFGRTVQFA